MAQAPASMVDDGGEDRRGNRTMLWVLAGALLLLVGGALVGKMLLGKPTAAKRQMARVTVVPDQPPPPPPPPPKVEKPPEPRDTPKPQPKEDTPKPQEAPKPADAPLKMEGPAGNGPSAFAGGAVTQDYKGGPVNSGASAPTVSGGGPASAGDRAQERFYATSARQQLRDELDRRMQGDTSALATDFSLWVAKDGAIQRFDFKPSGDDKADAELRAALDDAQRNVRLGPPPPAMQQPLRFRLTLRSAG